MGNATRCGGMFPEETFEKICTKIASDIAAHFSLIVVDSKIAAVLL